MDGACNTTQHVLGHERSSFHLDIINATVTSFVGVGNMSYNDLKRREKITPPPGSEALLFHDKRCWLYRFMQADGHWLK